MQFRSLRVIAFACALVLCLSSALLLAGPPGMSSSDFDAWLADYRAQVADETLKAKAPLPEARIAELKAEAAQRLDIDSLLPSQITTVLSMEFFDPADPETRRTLLQRLAKYRSDRNAEGAAAQAAFAMVNASESNATQMFQRALIHPSINEAIRDGLATGFFTSLRDSTDARDRQRIGSRIGTLSGACVASMSPQVLYEFEALHEVAQDALDDDELKEFRSAMLMAASAISLREDLNQTLGPNGAEFVSELVQTLAPPSAIAGGAVAPEIDFLWVSDGDFTKLSDLRGEIVVLDFWATWCGPCVASFPHVRAMQQRYAGMPVRIIGVTSEQGGVRMASGMNYARDLKHEIEMTQQFASDRGLTWTFAFSRQGVFNTDYGVSGIPHVAIIGPDGRLAHNGLRPYRPDEITANIDALLRESGLPAP